MVRMVVNQKVYLAIKRSYSFRLLIDFSESLSQRINHTQ